jgi:hypothetical protein
VTPLTIEEQMRLVQLLRGMDVPPFRLDPLDRGWMLRNISARNSEHPDLNEAVSLLKRAPALGSF